MKKKLFSWILCLAMVLQLAPMTGFAEGEENESLECQPISSAQDLAEGDTVVLLAQSHDEHDSGGKYSRKAYTHLVENDSCKDEEESKDIEEYL